MSKLRIDESRGQKRPYDRFDLSDVGGRQCWRGWVMVSGSNGLIGVEIDDGEAVAEITSRRRNEWAIQCRDRTRLVELAKQVAGSFGARVVECYAPEVPQPDDPTHNMAGQPLPSREHWELVGTVRPTLRIGEERTPLDCILVRHEQVPS